MFTVHSNLYNESSSQVHEGRCRLPRCNKINALTRPRPSKECIGRREQKAQCRNDLHSNLLFSFSSNLGGTSTIRWITFFSVGVCVDQSPERYPMSEEEGFPVQGLSLAAAFSPRDDPSKDPPSVRSLDFHSEGRLLLSLDSASNLLQIDTSTGEAVKRFTGGAKYDFGVAKYTHHSQAILVTSRPLEGPGADPAAAHAVRYLSLYDNSFLRLFPGHKGEVGVAGTFSAFGSKHPRSWAYSHKEMQCWIVCSVGF